MTTKRPIITVSVLVVCAIVAIISGFGERLKPVYPLFYSVYLEPPFYEIQRGQWWRIISPILLHFGALHLLMNGVMMWVFGRIIEPLHGKIVYVFLIIVMAAISNTAQYLVSGPVFGGLSGVLYGLLGFLWAAGKFIPNYPIRLEKRFVWAIMVWFLICWSGILSLFKIHIANTAHTAGLLSGIVLAIIFAKYYKQRIIR